VNPRIAVGAWQPTPCPAAAERLERREGELRLLNGQPGLGAKPGVPPGRRWVEPQPAEYDRPVSLYHERDPRTRARLPHSLETPCFRRSLVATDRTEPADRSGGEARG
jgi:hypothetical protein